MIAEGKVPSDLEEFKEVLPEFRDKLGSTVTGDTIGKAMMPTYFTRDSFSGFFTRDFLRDFFTIKIASNPLKTRRSVMKSRAMDCHGLLGISNGSNKPYG